MRKIFVFFVLWVGIASAQTFPILSGRVVDDAKILSITTKTEIEAKLKAFEVKSSDQVVVATIKSLEGYEIADYANRLFRIWKIGQAKQNNGVLLLIAQDDRKIRIEVGYGLEGTLTDALSNLIIRENIAPQFRAGNPNEGVTLAIDSIIKILSGNASEMQARAHQHAKTIQTNDMNFEQLLPFIIILLIFFFFFINAKRNQSMRMGQSHRRNPSWIIIPSSGGLSGGFGGSDNGGFSGGGGSSGGGGASGGW